MDKSIGNHFMEEAHMSNKHKKMLKLIANQRVTDDNHNETPFYIHQTGKSKDVWQFQTLGRNGAIRLIASQSVN